MLIPTQILRNYAYLESTVERKTVFPICSNIHLVLKDGIFLWSIATGTYQITVKVPVNSTAIEPFDVCVDAIKFFSIIKAIKGDTTTIEITPEGLLIRDDVLKVCLPIIDGAEFPDSLGQAPTFTFTPTECSCRGSDLDGLDKLPPFVMDFGNFTGVIIQKNTADLLTFFALSNSTLYRIDNVLGDYPRDKDASFIYSVPTPFISVLKKLPLSDAYIKFTSTTTGGLLMQWVNADATLNGFITVRLLPLPTFDYGQFSKRIPSRTFSLDRDGFVNLIKLYQTITEALNITFDILPPIEDDVPISIIDTVHNFVSKTNFTKIEVDEYAPFETSVAIDPLLLILGSLPNNNVVYHADDTRTVVVFESAGHTIFLAKVRRF